MPRIEPVTPERAGLATRATYAFAARRYGVVPEPFAVLVRELAVYRAAWTLGCSWCVDFGTMLQRLDGLDTERLAHIADYATSDLYSDDEKAAIAYADAVTGDVATAVTDEQVADLERRFGRAGVVELTYQIALENMRGRMNSALGIQEQGFSTDACRVPWADDAAAAGK